MNKHSENWIEIANDFLTPYNQRSDNQVNTTICGLCLASKEYGMDMYHKLFLLGDFGLNDNWIPERELADETPFLEIDALRGLAACFLATMPEDIYTDMVEAP